MLFPLTLAHLATAATVSVTPGPVNHGQVTGTVDIELAQVLEILSDCDGTDRWFPDLLESTVVAVEPDGAVRCRGVSDMPWPLADRTFELRITERLERIDGVDTVVVPFAYIEGSGNMEVMYGQYRLSALEDGRTFVDYEGWVDIGHWCPNFLIVWATQQLLPGILDGLCDEAERRSGFLADAAGVPSNG